MVMIDESLRSTIARLTGWNANAITNAITELIKKGELVRINDKSVKLNHKLANKFPAYGYLFEYRACQFKYTDAQENLIAELKTLIRKSDVPENAHEDEEKREAEVLAAIYDKLEVQSVQLQSQSEQLRDQSEQLKKQSDLLDRLLNKLEPYEPAEVQEIKKTHLEIVRDW
jgi:hypothetical protein